VNFNEHGIAKLERLKTYILTVEVPKKTNFVKSNAGYISALFQAGSVMGVGASVGGYIKNFKKVQDDDGHNVIRVFLKYDDSNAPVIHGMKKISTPGRRVYSGYKDLPRVYNGFGTLIISTSTGVTTGKKASEKMVGGELICTVW